MERYQRAFRAYGKSFILFLFFSILTGVAVQVLMLNITPDENGSVFFVRLLYRSLALPVIAIITMIFMQKAWSGESPKPQDLKLLPRVVIPVIIVNFAFAYYITFASGIYVELSIYGFFQLWPLILPLLALGILFIWMFRQIYLSLKAADTKNAFIRSFHIVFQHPIQSFVVLFRAFWPYPVALALYLCLLPLFGQDKLSIAMNFILPLLEPITAYLSIDCAMTLLSKLDLIPNAQ